VKAWKIWGTQIDPHGVRILEVEHRDRARTSDRLLPLDSNLGCSCTQGSVPISLTEAFEQRRFSFGRNRFNIWHVELNVGSSEHHGTVTKELFKEQVSALLELRVLSIERRASLCAGLPGSQEAGLSRSCGGYEE